jgi:hypothetical protein
MPKSAPKNTTPMTKSGTDKGTLSTPFTNGVCKKGSK